MPRVLNLCLNDFTNKTELGLYLTGLLAADGWLYNIGNKYRVGISLKESDSYLLDLFDSSLNHKFTRHIKRFTHKENSVAIDIYSKELFNVLEDLGLTPRKSFTLQFPNLTVYEMKHYLRGYFDGNGYMGSQPVLSSSSEVFKNDLTVYLCVNFNLAVLTTSGNRGLRFRVDSKPFFNWLYTDCNYYMLRKKEAVFIYVND